MWQSGECLAALLIFFTLIFICLPFSGDVVVVGGGGGDGGCLFLIVSRLTLIR